MRLIDADALKEQVLLTMQVYKTNGKFDEPLARFCKLLKEEIKAIDHAPTIDAEPVVRCKDCKYWQDNNGGYPHEECRWGKEETPDGDDYCSYGERREP